MILMKFELYRHVSKISSNIKFHEKPSEGAELFFVEGRTDGHDEAASFSSQFCERA
jgi:hypothetical protein